MRTSPEVLARLAEDDYFYVWEKVPGNPSTPAETREKLAEHKNWGVCMNVASNTSRTPLFTMGKAV
ncbi:MAG TPA: hypothetical protein VM911_15110 [Pyrinomonadaceae bacterium]|jgi:hypothetical protein|nr:hypothetical protein [Pyrinomonadaceae bacterium]